MKKARLFIKYANHLGVFSFLDYLVRRFIRKDKILLLKVPGLTHRVAIRNNSSDIPLFAHIFILGEYNVQPPAEVHTIIDCGANVGLASLFFLTMFPKARIIAIEPEENNYRLLCQNLYKYKNTTCIQKGIWDKTTHLEIIDHGWGNHAFIVKELPNAVEASIPAVSIDDILIEFGLQQIDILKIDIEGSEEQVFLGNPGWIKNVNMIFCEIHDNLKPGLSGKIKSVLGPYFDFSVNGEYDVFKRKKHLLKEN